MKKGTQKTHKRGAAVITMVLFLVIIGSALAVGLASPVVRDYTGAREFDRSKGAYYLTESGQEDAIYRLKRAKSIDAEEVLSLGGNTATTTVDSGVNTYGISTVGDVSKHTRKTSAGLTTAVGMNFTYGMQSGPGGVIMKDNARIVGNLYANGPVTGEAGTLVTGAIISAGPNGSVASSHANGSIYSHTITNSTIGGDAYYQSVSGSSVSGTSYPGSVDIATTSLPITQAQIAQWESNATSTVVTCTSAVETITGTVTIGPVKYIRAGNQACKLKIDGNAVVTLAGPVWVYGDIEIKSLAQVKVDPSLSGQSVVMIADNTADHLNSSNIKIEGNAVFTGAGTGSYVMLLGQNDGASRTPPQMTEAIEVEDDVIGELLVYAGLGDIKIKGDAQLREATGYQITMEGNAILEYQTGLQNALFVSGPAGAWAIQDWKESQ